jgi:hypothetical protein
MSDSSFSPSLLYSPKSRWESGAIGDLTPRCSPATGRLSLLLQNKRGQLPLFPPRTPCRRTESAPLQYQGSLSGMCFSPTAFTADEETRDKTPPKMPSRSMSADDCFEELQYNRGPSFRFPPPLMGVDSRHKRVGKKAKGRSSS